VTTPQHADTVSGVGSRGDSVVPALTLDALGKKCPIPIIMLAERIRDVEIGQVIAVLADDPAAKTDVPAWCALKSQEFLRAEELAPRYGDARPGWSFLVRRSY
jgi:tRNA 2-thiouridine synthesizing protein A